MDFGFDKTNNVSTNDDKQDINNQPDDTVTNLDNNNSDDNKNNDDKNNPHNDNDDKDNKNDDDKNNKDNDKGDKDNLELTSGTKIEIGENTYTVDNEGNLVDDKGEVFKKADEVSDYLKTLEQSDDDDSKELSIETIQKALGIEITDENDKPVSFENTPEGINQYINAVIETSQQEIAETAVNTLFQRYPILQDFLNYYVANGNSAEGFNGKPDRSAIVIDDNNQAQQEEIIRTAWKEQNRKGSIDDYIAYLKSSGTLAAVAKEELDGLKELDASNKKALADKAKQEEEAERLEQEKYWNGVKEVIDSKKIAGYKIPDTIIIERDGKKVAATPNDFFNYIYRTDKNGITQYQADLIKETPESRRDDEILRAYLKFVGGNYSNLVDMAINDKEVTKLRFKAKENTTRKTSYKVVPPTTENKKDINLGY